MELIRTKEEKKLKENIINILFNLINNYYLYQGSLSSYIASLNVI